jgi:hypothetical protein
MKKSMTRPIPVVLTMLSCSFLLVLLAACSADATGASSPSSASPTAQVSPTVTEAMLVHEMVFVGKPAAKMDAGTTFEVDGKLKNGDDKQHDIYIQAFLLDASGKVIATTQPQNIDNVPGNTTVPYSIQGTTPQPTWTSVQVKIVKVTENVNGIGTD